MGRAGRLIAAVVTAVCGGVGCKVPPTQPPVHRALEARENPENPALPRGVLVATVALGDVPTSRVVRGVVEVPGARLRTLQSPGAGIAGRSEEGAWPVVGMAVRDCQVLVQVTLQAPMPAAFLKQQIGQWRRCASKRRRANAARRGEPPGAQTWQARATCDGRIGRVAIGTGARVMSGAALATVACDEDLRIRAVELGATATAALNDAWLIDPSGAPPAKLAGRVEQGLQWRLPADAGWATLGSQVDLELSIGAGAPALVVPSTAVELGDGRARVHVWRDGKAHAREVQARRGTPEQTIIEAGLEPGEVVVTAGFSTLGIQRAPRGK